MPKQWFPLESNPDVMNGYASKLGLDVHQFQFCDVLSTEEWALELITPPVLAVIMLFPISANSEAHRLEEHARIMLEGQVVSPSIYYMKQTVDNACGTVGILHALINAQNSGIISPYPPNSYVAEFIQKTKSLSPDERAAFLEADDEIELVHESAASEGQSHQLDVNNVNSHFVCFSAVDGCLYELDGRKSFPINHGPSSIATLLNDACRVIKEYMSRDPTELRFTMVALCATLMEDELLK